MKIEQAHIDQIRKQFAELQSKNDLVKLLSDAKNMLYGEECKPFQLKSLTYYANPTLCKKRYQTFTIKKKSGADRTIHAPVKGLKSILRSLNFVLQCVYEPHEAATGFVLEKSIVDNAKKHVKHHYVLNMDLKDFFHTFDRNRVKMGFMYEPFNLNGDKEPLAFLLASLCTHPFEIDGEVKTVLPQGSPTSPTLTNILCKKLDRRLTGLANRFGATYTRYADDITFSSPQNIYTDEAFNKELKRIIEEDQKLVINPKKTRLQKAGYRQEATGLIVNDKVNVRRRYVKQIRMWLYYWEKYGYEKAEQIFKRDYIADKGHVKNMNAHLVNVLDGKLEFLKMVKGEIDGTYKGLKERFDKLTGLNKSDSTKSNDELEKQYKLSELSEEESNDISPARIPELHTPRELVKILQLFSNNNNPLKYTTHSWEYGMFDDYNDFIIKITSEWKKINKILKSLNERLHAKISNYLFNNQLGKKEDGKTISWGEHRITIGWSSPELKNYCLDGNKSPFYFPIPETHQKTINDKQLSYFSDVVDVFKNEIEFREENNQLYQLLLKLRKDILGYDFKIELPDDIKGLSFYTDVAWVSNGIKKIFEAIRSRPQYNTVRIKVLRNFTENFIEINIIHVNSRCNRTIEDPRIINCDSGDLSDLRKIFRNLCDWSIIAQFPDNKIYKINYLLSSSEQEKIESVEHCEGFTHLLKFYL